MDFLDKLNHGDGYIKLPNIGKSMQVEIFNYIELNLKNKLNTLSPDLGIDINTISLIENFDLIVCKSAPPTNM